MKYNKILAICASAVLAMTAGCDKYDDSALWNDIDKAYNELTAIKPMVEAVSQQVEMVSAVISSGAITNITTAEDGGYVVSYKGADNIEHSVTIASKNEVTTAPVIGTKTEDGVLYWTIGGEFLKDLDGAKVAVAGRVPSFDVNKDGYWTINGAVLNDVNGNPIKAEGKELSVISKVEKTEDGKGIITLGDGSTITVDLFEAFSISVFDGQAELLKQHLVTMPSNRTLTLSYVLAGPEADQTIIKITRETALTAVLDPASKTIIRLKLPSSKPAGNVTLIVFEAGSRTAVSAVSRVILMIV